MRRWLQIARNPNDAAVYTYEDQSACKASRVLRTYPWCRESGRLEHQMGQRKRSMMERERSRMSAANELIIHRYLGPNCTPYLQIVNASSSWNLKPAWRAFWSNLPAIHFFESTLLTLSVGEKCFTCSQKSPVLFACVDEQTDTSFAYMLQCQRRPSRFPAFNLLSMQLHPRLITMTMLQALRSTSTSSYWIPRERVLTVSTLLASINTLGKPAKPSSRPETDKGSK